MTRLPCRQIAKTAHAVGKGAFRGMAGVGRYACWRALSDFSWARGPGTGRPGGLNEKRSARRHFGADLGAHLVDQLEAVLGFDVPEGPAVASAGALRHGALVRADGAIMLGDKVGSIHRIGAVAQGAEACNGWTFWHIETNKGLKLIDELRAEIRSEMAVG